MSTSSTSRLVLLPDNDDRDRFQDYSTGENENESENEDEDEDEDETQQPTNLPSLTRPVVFLYLLSPYLRLGAIYASDIANTPRTYGLTGLIVAASLSAFCRQIWFLLGRYLRKSSTEDILVHIFARRHPRARKHGFARYACTIVIGLFRILLAAMYLRDAVDAILLVKAELIPSLSRVNISISLSILVFVLSLSRSLASRSVVYATSFSLVSYLAWLAAVSQSYVANRPPLPRLSSSRRGILWNQFSSFAFACSTGMTVPLSVCLLAGNPSVSPASRNARAKSFQLLNVFSTLLAASLMLPIPIMAASPRAPVSKAVPDNLLLSLRTTTLVLSIPSILASATVLPLQGVAMRFVRTDLVSSVITLVILALSLVPPTIASILDDITLFVAVSGAFLLPALAHITIHYFRRPLSIVVPQEPSSVPSTPPPSDRERSPSPSRDPLLQRKERLLQRRRFGKRLFWDIVVWVILIPISVCALVWAAGRLALRW